jgi:hypothetical protein
MQIQPVRRHLEEEGVEGRHGQERAAEGHQARSPATTAPMRIACTSSPCASTAAGSRPPRGPQAERRPGEHEGRDEEEREREIGSGVCCCRIGPRNGIPARPGSSRAGKDDALEASISWGSARR